MHKQAIRIAVILALGTGASGEAYAHAGNSDPNVIHACVNARTGAGLKIVAANSGNCPAGKTALHWSVTGPIGPQAAPLPGTQGPAGPTPSYSFALTVGKEADDGTGRPVTGADYVSIQAALDSIPNDIYSNGVCNARYLVKIMPGTYNERVTMKPCVDIEGSGELTTRITSAGGADAADPAATLKGADEAELRFLTVDSIGGNIGIAIRNEDVSPRLTHVTATAAGGSGWNFGVMNYLSRPTMTNVTATASGGTIENTGVANSVSRPIMTNVTATASGGTNSNGVANQKSSPTMTNVAASGSGASGTNSGVYNSTSSSPTMTNVTATASGGTYSYGVYSFDAPTSQPVIIQRSTLRGATNSLVARGRTVRVGASQLEGPVKTEGTGAAVTCAGVYDGNYVFYASTCP